MRYTGLAVVLACVSATWGQGSASREIVTPPRVEPTGTVTGHVMCADTQRPARLADVKLVRVPTRADAPADQKHGSFNGAAPSSDAVETGLDGAYTLRNVKPGQYYLAVDKEGYLLPLGSFTQKDLAATDDEGRQRVARAVHPITVESGQITQEDVVLERGASISGTVLYDDGSPAAGIGIQVLAKNKEGKWTPVEALYRTHYVSDSTDDLGHYRITGLPAGEYATQANLSLNETETTFGPMPNHPENTISLSIQKTRFSLPLYSGDVLRKPAAKSYTLGTGEARAGDDLTFPLAKLHKVGGQVLAKDGHPLNGGKVTLVYPDDNTEMTETDLQQEARVFALDFVPEGDFLLKVTGAADVTKIQVANSPGYTPRFHEEEKTLKTYGDTEQPLIVKGDTSDVIVTMPGSAK